MPKWPIHYKTISPWKNNIRSVKSHHYSVGNRLPQHGRFSVGRRRSWPQIETARDGTFFVDTNIFFSPWTICGKTAKDKAFGSTYQRPLNGQYWSNLIALWWHLSQSLLYFGLSFAGFFVGLKCVGYFFELGQFSCTYLLWNFHGICRS